MDGGVWWAAVHGVTGSRARLSHFTFTFHFHALEKEMATHSSVLAWRIPGTGEPGWLPSMGSHRVGHDWSDLAAAACYNQKKVWLKKGTSGWNKQPEKRAPLAGPSCHLGQHSGYSVQSLSRVQLLAIPWTAAHQASLFITTSRSLLKLMSIESVMPSNHLSSVIPFSSWLQSYPASGSFPRSQFFTLGR